MTTPFRVLAAALLLWVLPATASAQWQMDMDFQGATVYYHGLGIAPYQLQIPAPGGPVIDVFCVDPRVTAHSQTYTGWVSPVTPGTLQHTKVYAGYGASTAFEAYWKTAWLGTQYNAITPTSGNLTTRAAIQGAIWEIGGMLGPGVGGGAWAWTSRGRTAPTGIDTWVTAANTAFRTDTQQIDGSEWLVLTTADDRDQQEFLAHRTNVAPEPATWAFLATGLLIVLGVGIRRERVA